jgi:Na+/H+-dicarboxylate symporter
VIVATGSMSGKGAGGLAARTFGWMISFSVVAALLAWGLSSLLRPGAGMVFDGELDPALTPPEPTSWQDTVLGFVSTNIFEAMSTATMVPIIIFSLLFGAALNAYIARTGNRLVLGFFDQLQQIVLTMIRFVMYVAPVGVFCLLAALAGDVGFAVVTTALSYLGTTLLGVVILLVLFVTVVTLRTRLSPWRLPRKLAEQTAIAVTTTSSAVTYPTVLRNAVEKVGISKRVASFTLSVGLTMGSYGAVLNYMIVVMFLAQAGDVTLSPGQLVLGLPFEAVGLLIAVDWFTGIFRTFLNVNGDTLVAMLVANASGEIDRDVYDERKTVAESDVSADAEPNADESNDTAAPLNQPA